MEILQHLIAAFLLVQAAPFLHAVDNVSGELRENLSGQDLSAITSLTVRGTMDVRDFLLMQEEMPNLVSVDLAGVDVTAYSGKESLVGNYVGFEADELPAFCFAGMALREVVLPQSVTAVGEGSFAGCARLQSIELPPDVEEIGDMAFAGCSDLVSVTGYGKMARIGEYAFNKCVSLANVALPSVEVIGSRAFNSCASLTSFPFFSGLTQIGDGAFCGSGLVAADLSGCRSLSVIGAWAFADNHSLAEVALPAGLESLGDGAFFYNTSLGDIELPEIVKINDFTFAGGKMMTNRDVLPASLREIGDYALSDWSSIAEIVIPENVEYIGTGAFRNQTSVYRIESLAAQPPLLGDDVWENVDKSGVTLVVPENSESLYRTAEQWREFFNAASAVNSIKSSLEVAVDDNLLILKSVIDIKVAALYDMNGVMLSYKEPDSATAEFYLGGYSGNLYIVRCVLDNGKVEILKIARN